MPTNCLLQPDEDRLADEKMADVQFNDLCQRGDGPDRVVGQSVAGVDLQADANAVARRFRDPEALAF
jgi:hypothetical protein